MREQIDEVANLVNDLKAKEDRKVGKSTEERIQLLDQQMLVWEEIYVKAGRIISKW